MPPGANAAATVVCPLAFEAAGIRRAMRRRFGPRVEVLVAGPGRDAAARAVAAAIEGGASRLVLAGLAGGLREVGGAVIAAKVVDETGRIWACPPVPEKAGPQWATILATSAPVYSLSEKAAWRERSGAVAVDTESHGFAAACCAAATAGWTGSWSIVRAVSDGPDEVLPARTARWVTAQGRTRVGRLVLDLLRRPRLLPSVVRLGRRGKAALKSVSGCLERLLE